MAARATGAHRLGDPADLWVGGFELGELLADDGTVDPARVASAVDRVVTEHPSWAARPVDLGQGVRGSTKAAGPSWRDVLEHRVEPG